MTRSNGIPRRAFVKATIGTAAVLSTGMSAGCSDSTGVDRKLQFRSLSQAMDEAEYLAANSTYESATLWTLPQTLVHCAQSIEFSMTGFPQSKSAAFQNTAGAAALAFFAWRGRMSHDLNEEIPGAPSVMDATDINAALARLHQSVAAFERAEEPLQPHFAYGELSKADYELAQAMHLANHFSAIPV